MNRYRNKVQFPVGVDKSGVVSGPVPLPTQKKIFTVNRSTFVNKKAREQFQLCTFKRILDIYSSTPKTIDALMKLELPSGVEVEIKV
ncbi:30S ribosomal protein S10 [Alistipes ihumii]|uniref:30S ribosomal protein S10 n=1 Tax=Alistipes ihumii TaxID=1470347 RepID=UPI00307CBB7E